MVGIAFSYMAGISYCNTGYMIQVSATKGKQIEAVSCHTVLKIKQEQIIFFLITTYDKLITRKQG